MDRTHPYFCHPQCPSPKKNDTGRAPAELPPPSLMSARSGRRKPLTRTGCPLCSKKRTSKDLPRHVRFVPCVDGSELARTFFTPAGWSVQPSVRPFDAVHMTAGHNALRGSGPGQNRAFKDAVALMGCPDRRIDRLCITCCSSSQPSHHTGSV